MIQISSSAHPEGIMISLHPEGEEFYTQGVTHLTTHEHRGHSELFPRDVAIVDVPLGHAVVPTGYHYQENSSMSVRIATMDFLKKLSRPHICTPTRPTHTHAYTHSYPGRQTPRSN